MVHYYRDQFGRVIDVTHEPEDFQEFLKQVREAFKNRDTVAIWQEINQITTRHKDAFERLSPSDPKQRIIYDLVVRVSMLDFQQAIENQAPQLLPWIAQMPDPFEN